MDSEKTRINFDLVKQEPLFGKVSEVLLGKYNSFVVYGGMAVMAEQGDLAGFSKFVKGEETIDLSRTGDIDLMVEEIDNVADLGNNLKNSLGEEIEIVVNEGDYPRIDVLKDGVEVMSISELKSSAAKIREIRNTLGLPEVENDWELYFKSKNLVNFEFPIMVNNTGDNVMQWGEARVFGEKLDINPEGLYTIENFERLKELGREDLAADVIREYAYWTGKLGMLKILNFGTYEPELSGKYRAEMRKLSESGVIDNYPKAKEVLAERIVKMANGSFQWARNGLSEYGLMWWFSPILAKELEDMEEKNWNKLNDTLSLADRKIESGERTADFDDFINLLMDGMEINEEKQEMIKEELSENFKPRIKNSANWYGQKI